jgi:hypothetical protein
MDFLWNEELKMLKDMAYKFGQAEVAPVARQADADEAYTPEIRKRVLRKMA